MPFLIHLSAKNKQNAKLWKFRSFAFVLSKKGIDMKHKLIPIAVALLFILAAALAFYPLVSNALAEQNRSIVRTEYTEQIEQADDAELADILAAAQEYNAALTGAFDPERGTEGYYDQLAVSDSGVIGYVEIPKIGVYLPIYHGTDADALDAGAGHLIGSSLPIGGAGTHTALSAHSGLAREKMFSDLDRLAISDVFYLHILGQTLAYEVDEINTVLPEDTSLLGIEPEQDYCTLITCTPFGVNSHRLLVRGTRIEYEPEIATVQHEATTAVKSTWQQEYIRGILIGLCAAALFAVALFLARHRKRGKHERR